MFIARPFLLRSRRNKEGALIFNYALSLVSLPSPMHLYKRLEPQGHAATGEVESLAAVSPYSTITDDRFEPPKHETAGEWRRRFPYLK